MISYLLFSGWLIIYKPSTDCILEGYHIATPLCGCISKYCGLVICKLILYVYMHILMIRVDGILVGSAPAIQAM